MSSITGILNVDNTLTGVEDLYLDELDANTIILGGTDLQTTLTDLQDQITTGGGYFQIICEKQVAALSNAYFSFGANTNDGELFTYLPNSTCYGIALSAGGTITSPVDIDIIINGNTTTYSIPNGTASTFTNYNLNIAVSQGQTLRAKFGTNLGVGGSNFRITLFFRTSAVNGTNGTNGTNGQNVSFNTPTITTITPATAASISDTITTASGTQTHALNFNIPRGKNSSFQVGTISSVGTGSPTLDLSQSTNANGDNVYTMNFGLQQGIQGNQGAKGDKGDQGSQAQSTIDAIASAIAAAASAAAAGGFAAAAAGSAAAASASAATAAANGAQAGAQAGTEAAEEVVNDLDERVTALEGEVDNLNDKTFYISRNGTETNIAGSKTNITSTNGLETSTLIVNNVITANEGLSVLENSYFNGDILMGDNKKILTNIIRQRQYPAIGDMLIDATNINLGGINNNFIKLQSDNINITTNSGAGFTTFNCDLNDTDTQVVVEGSLEAKNLNITNNATINNDLLVEENLTAGTDGELNEHTFYGTFFTQKIEAIDNDNPLNIGEDTNEFQILANNITIGHLDVGETTTTINNKTISIGETLADTLVSIGGDNSKISCDGTTDTITLDTTNLTINATNINTDCAEINIGGTEINIGIIPLNNTCNLNPTILNISTDGTNAEPFTLNIGNEFCDIDMEANNLLISVNDITIDGDFTLGNALDLNTNVLIQNRNVNIATTQIGMTAPTLNLGTYNRTTTEVRGETIEILASETTSINGSNNLVLDATAIDIGNAGGDVNIIGSTIDIGTTGVLNTVNIGNNFSIVNISTNITGAINFGNFVNQIGF